MDLRTSEYSRVAKLFYHKALEVITKDQLVLVTMSVQRSNCGVHIFHSFALSFSGLTVGLKIGSLFLVSA